ncbi:uncharacterized protein LOC119100631 [Pollicipes pollicipes]|uniref:uncharacterized protein LOC119100631 n=1 Tax=Pollicipes pollicipes TaxID=41117 RepID=UPI001884D4E9|nr:uncharacterized protein LOC119100631 [Pollicipes pollicipes]
MDCLEVFVSHDSYPPQHELSYLVHDIMLVSEDETLLRRCLRLLRVVAGYHAPHSQAMRAVWYDALAVDSVPIAYVLEKARGRCLDAGLPSRCHVPLTEFFDFLVTLLEEDMTAWSSSALAARRLQGRPAGRPLLAHVVWPCGEPGFSRHDTASICQWLVTAHVGPADMTMRLLLLRLMAMAAGLVQISSEREDFPKVSEGMKELAMELARTVENADLPPAAVEELLCSLRPAWLCAWTAAGLLESRYGRLRPAQLSLQVLADTYLMPERRDARRPSPACTENENSWSAGPQVSFAANGERSKDVAGAAAGRKRCSQSPPASPARKRPFAVNGVDADDERTAPRDGASALPPDPDEASPAAPAAASRDYSLLAHHLLTGYLLHSGVTEYNGELRFIEERLWRWVVNRWLHPRFARYMRNVTKL